MLGRILVVDDEQIIRDILKISLENEGFSADGVPSLASMEENLKQRTYDAVLLDLYLEKEDGLQALPLLMRQYPYTKVIVMSAHGTIELAVSAMEQGASAFIAKSKDPFTIVQKLKERLSSPSSESASCNYDTKDMGMIGSGAAMQAVYDRIMRVKDVNSTVLITGESGTGKEMVARAIHRLSNRKSK